MADSQWTQDRRHLHTVRSTLKADSKIKKRLLELLTGGQMDFAPLSCVALVHVVLVLDIDAPSFVRAPFRNPFTPSYISLFVAPHFLFLPP